MMLKITTAQIKKEISYSLICRWLFWMNRKGDNGKKQEQLTIVHGSAYQKEPSEVENVVCVWIG